MFVKDVMVQNQVGLHARPATFLFKKQTSSNHQYGLKKTQEELMQKAFWGYFL